MEKIYEITDEQGQIVIRFDRGLVDPGTLNKLLDYLELESFRKRSRLGEEQADELAKEVDQAVWDQVKHKYTGD